MRCCHVLIQISQDGSMLRHICMFLRRDLPIQLLLKLLSSIDIIHGTGLEINHVSQLVVYILYSAMRVWDYFTYSLISQEN